MARGAFFEDHERDVDSRKNQEIEDGWKVVAATIHDPDTTVRLA
jgi:hypothetical protein